MLIMTTAKCRNCQRNFQYYHRRERLFCSRVCSYSRQSLRALDRFRSRETRRTREKSAPLAIQCSVEETATRRTNCERYDDCLDAAARSDWRNFSCPDVCSGFVPLARILETRRGVDAATWATA